MYKCTNTPHTRAFPVSRVGNCNGNYKHTTAGAVGVDRIRIDNWKGRHDFIIKCRSKNLRTPVILSSTSPSLPSTPSTTLHYTTLHYTTCTIQYNTHCFIIRSTVSVHWHPYPPTPPPQTSPPGLLHKQNNWASFCGPGLDLQSFIQDKTIIYSSRSNKPSFQIIGPPSLLILLLLLLFILAFVFHPRPSHSPLYSSRNTLVSRLSDAFYTFITSRRNPRDRQRVHFAESTS